MDELIVSQADIRLDELFSTFVTSFLCFFQFLSSLFALSIPAGFVLFCTRNKAKLR